MKPRLTGSLLCLASLSLAGAIVAFAQGSPGTPKESPARSQVEQLIRQAHADVSVAFRSLDGTQQLFLKPDTEFSAAPSVIQIPVMIELFAEAQAGELRLSDTIVVNNNFQSLLDGENYRLDPKTDPDQDLYKAVGKSMTLRDICEHMMARNSSLAADLLVEKLGADRIRRRIEQLRAGGIQLNRGIEPDKPNDIRPDNAASARGMFELLWSLAKGQNDGDESSMEMIGMMARAAYSQLPTAGMPPDPRAAQSTRLAAIGENAMIVFGPHPYVVVIVVRGITNLEARAELVALIEHALAAGLDAAT
jgi:beta-lactamase class A